MTERAALSDYPELLSFENRIFDVNFLEKVPKLYTDPAACAACHGLIRADDRIVAAIAAYPTALVTDCGTLHAVGIGSVAVDGSARGRGCMRDMMAFCGDIAAKQNADLAFLSGSRGRYEHDGFIPCGSRFCFEISPYFLAHFKGETDYDLTPLKDDPSGAESARALFEAQPLHWLRSERDFLTITATWGAQAFSVRGADGAFCGYLIYEPARMLVSELLLHENGKAAGVLTAFARQLHVDCFTVNAEPTQTALIDALADFGEHITTQMPVAFKIYRFRHVLEVLGSYKARHFALPEGTLVLQIGDEILRVSVRDNRCTAEPTDETPELIFSEKEAAVRLTTAFGALVPHALFAAWAPLCPLGIARPDGV